jgi:hypothetical protein
MRSQQIDGNALVVAARRSSQKRFQQQMDHYRKAGFSDGEIVAAMASSHAVINAIGPRSMMRTPRVQYKNFAARSGQQKQLKEERHNEDR